MAPGTRTKRRDRYEQQILDVLASYKKSHPKAKIDVYRQNSASIRIRIIDPDFKGKDHVDRDSELWKIVSELPEEVQSQITFLLLLTPDETATSFANSDFESPLPSKL